MEEQLTIDLKGDSLGHYVASCIAIDRAGIGNRLFFDLEFDQSDIPEIIKGIDSVIREFPVVGDPTRP
jgi:hypothetical protein